MTGAVCLALLALALVVLPVTRAEDLRLATLFEVRPARLAGWRGRWAWPGLHGRGRWWALLAGTLGTAAVAGPAAGVAAGLVAAAALATVRSMLDRRTAGRAEDAVLEAVEALAADLRAGLSPSAALRSAAEVADGRVAAVLTEAASIAALGGDAAEVLRAATEADALRRVSAAWQVSSISGASLGDVLDRVENDLRADRAHGRRIDAELAGPRATAVLLAVLPVLGLGLGASMGAHPGHVLLHTVPGQLALVIGAGLDALGVWWTTRIIVSAQGAA